MDHATSVERPSNPIQKRALRPTTASMKGPSFRFRLERVRELRERHEDEAKMALAAALADHFRAEEQVQAAEQRIEEARMAQLDAARSQHSAVDMLAHQAYLERTESDHRASREDLDLRETELNDRRDALTQAARDRQALERLKDRRRAEHQREADRVEALALDEIAINGYRRNAA
jgi:flagellar protein FliJ